MCDDDHVNCRSNSKFRESLPVQSFLMLHFVLHFWTVEQSLSAVRRPAATAPSLANAYKSLAIIPQILAFDKFWHRRRAFG